MLPLSTRTLPPWRWLVHLSFALRSLDVEPPLFALRSFIRALTLMEDLIGPKAVRTTRTTVEPIVITEKLVAIECPLDGDWNAQALFLGVGWGSAYIRLLLRNHVTKVLEIQEFSCEESQPGILDVRLID